MPGSLDEQVFEEQRDELIHRRVRALGRPLAGAAFGGNLKPDLVATQGGTA
jgi:hypothetical protein